MHLVGFSLCTLSYEESKFLSSFQSFLHPPVTSHPWDQRFLLTILLSNMAILSLILSVSDQVSYSEKLHASLVLCQGYIPEKNNVNQNWTNQTQNSHLTQCISCVLGDWQPHPIWCVTALLKYIQTCRVCMYSIYSIYTFLYNMFIYV